MKLLRNRIIRSDQQQHKIMLNSEDFYTLSSLRDLLFHAQEHRFTIPELKTLIDQLGLKFCGFETDILKDFLVKNSDQDSAYDLDKRQLYEETNPSAFGRMYQFWCQKTN